MIFSKIAGDISEIAGDLAISEQSVKDHNIKTGTFDQPELLDPILM
jgi:hypothetical protein